jgi:putative endonuclease
MSDSRRQLGNWGEEQASAFLRAQGYRIVERNWRCSAGEVDIVARDGEQLVFVEVRTRRGRNYGAPEESITTAKQAKLIELAQSYLQENPELECAWRIDVVALELRGSQLRMQLIRHAVME